MQALDSIPEMELEVLIHIMRASFVIVTEPVEGKPYAVRFVGSPYNPFVEDCRSIQIFTHNMGRTVSPHNIKAVLAKFEIEEVRFIEAMYSSRPHPSENEPQVAKEAKPN